MTITREFAFYCRCGGSWKGTFAGSELFVNKNLADMEKRFQHQHSAPGCELCDAKTCARARRKNEKAVTA